ncbi:MAG: hypothetical protein QM607_11090 [Microbacterium sp.]
MGMGTMLRSKVGIGVAGAGALMLALAGCTQDASDTGETADGASAQFVACLKAAGVDAKISDEGYVLVKIASQIGGSISSSSDDGGEAPIMLVGDGDGSSWVAAQSSAYFTADPDTQDAYAGCEAEHPDFEQPEYDPANDPQVQEQQEQQAAAGLEFARCARDEGFAWVADPDTASGAIVLPADLTEAEFRAVLTACWDAENPGLAWSLPDGDLGFDWQAVLEEFSGGVTSGSSSISVGGDE